MYLNFQYCCHWFWCKESCSLRLCACCNRCKRDRVYCDMAICLRRRMSYCITRTISFIFTARIRRMREGIVFSLSVHTLMGKGVPPSFLTGDMICKYVVWLPCKQGIHIGIETLGRRQQKSKLGVSMASQKGPVSSKTFKKKEYFSRTQVKKDFFSVLKLTASMVFTDARLVLALSFMRGTMTSWNEQKCNAIWVTFKGIVVIVCVNSAVITFYGFHDNLQDWHFV